VDVQPELVPVVHLGIARAADALVGTVESPAWPTCACGVEALDVVPDLSAYSTKKQRQHT
jgi:hypothetical protein